MKIIALLAPLFLLASSLSQAAEVPKSMAKLEATATHVIRGTVIDVTTKIEKSKIHTNPDTQTDTIHTITVQVEGVSKGDAAKKDEKISILAWKPHTREPEGPGRQGQDLIPKIGDTGTFYLTGGSTEPLELVTPNGVVVDKAMKPAPTPAINLWVDLGLGLISKEDAKAKMEAADGDFKTALDSDIRRNGNWRGVPIKA